jgi:hypothetical protein
LLLAVLASLLGIGLAVVPGTTSSHLSSIASADAAMPIYAPWDAGKTFDVGSPPGTYDNHNYYGHCCYDQNGSYISSEYYAVDINKPNGADDCGETIRATNSGTVTTGVYVGAGVNGSNIPWLRVDHSEIAAGYISEYQHMISPTGATHVNRGYPIGRMGSAGATACHLHFVVKHNGTSIPPSPMSGYSLPTGVTGVAVISDNTPASSSSGSVGTRLLGDVNGDGKSDAVVKFRDTGTAMVALSTGASFSNPPQPWAYLQTVNADKYFLADVNGDGRSDMAAYWASIGRWWVSMSDGNGFFPETSWAEGQGVGSSKQFLSDVNADGKSDLVLYWASSGTWYVSISNGSAFGSPSLWSNGNGVGTNDQQVADFTGDAKADAGVYVASNGSWYVGTSTGVSFGSTPSAAFSPWSSGHGLGSDKRMVGDATGNAKVDIGYFFISTGISDVGSSEGGGFYAPTRWATGVGVNSDDQFLGDATGDGKADLITYHNASGTWNVANSNGTVFGYPNTWITGHGAGS